MDSGGSTALWPPGKFCFNQPATHSFCAASQSNLGTFAENLEYSYHPDTHPFGAAAYGVQNRSRRFCLKSPKHLWCCKVKPHGSLVLVSSMHRCTYTPSLSTSSSLTFLQGGLKPQGRLISRQVSRLDAFSGYLFRI